MTRYAPAALALLAGTLFLSGCQNQSSSSGATGLNSEYKALKDGETPTSGSGGSTTPGAGGTSSTTPGASAGGGVVAGGSPTGTAVEAPAAKVEEGEVALRLGVKKGETFRFKQTTEAKLTLPAMGSGTAAKPASYTVATGQTYTISDVKNDVFDVEIRTDKPEVVKADEAAQQLVNMLGGDARTMNFTYDALGKPGAQTGSVLRGVPGSSDSILQSGFLGIVFPTDGVKVGDKWTNKVDIAKQMGLPPNVEVKNPDMTVTYVLKSIDRNGDRAVISINATGNPSISSQMMAGGRGSDGNTQTQARTMTFKMNMSMTGTATLDLSSGVLRTAEYRLKIGTDGGPALANQDMTVKIERQ